MSSLKSSQTAGCMVRATLRRYAANVSCGVGSSASGGGAAVSGGAFLGWATLSSRPRTLCAVSAWSAKTSAACSCSRTEIPLPTLPRDDFPDPFPLSDLTEAVVLHDPIWAPVVPWECRLPVRPSPSSLTSSASDWSSSNCAQIKIRTGILFRVGFNHKENYFQLLIIIYVHFFISNFF